jgi:hypothetical protein
MAGRVAVYPLRQAAASKMRTLADKMQDDHPELDTHKHMRDAAAQMLRGNDEGTKRHLQAAMFDLTPLQLWRHGITDHPGSQLAKRNMTGVHRVFLHVRDIEDADQRNRENIARQREQAAGDTPASPPAAAGTQDARPGLSAAQRGNGVTPPQLRPAAISSQGTPRPVGLAYELSAQTARLAATPAPRGRPGGPGLYGVKGNEHSPYFQQVVKALIEKRGMPPEKAYPIAWAALRKWMRGGGKVHPEVRAAAAGGLAMEKAAEARAHAHTADPWSVIDLAVEMAATTQGGQGQGQKQGNQSWQSQQRVPKGQAGGGQFGSKGGAQTAKGHAGGGGSAAGRARQKAALLMKARELRQHARQLAIQLAALEKTQKASAKSTAKATKAGQTGKASSSTPAKKTQAAKTGTPAKAKTGTASVATRISSLRRQIRSLLAQAAAAVQQARAL